MHVIVPSIPSLAAINQRDSWSKDLSMASKEQV